MASARPLREVFADLVGVPSATADPAALLSEHGHPGLPDDLIAEAVVSYAQTAPVEVAEQLAPFVTAHSAAGTGDDPAAGWLDLLAGAPDVADDEPADLDDLTPAPDTLDPADLDDNATGPEAGLDFGTGAGEVPVIEPGAVDEVSADDFLETDAVDLTADDFTADDFANDFDEDREPDDGEQDGEQDGGPLG